MESYFYWLAFTVLGDALTGYHKEKVSPSYEACEQQQGLTW